MTAFDYAAAAACATVQSVSDAPDPTAHKMPAMMASETLIDIIDNAHDIQLAITNDEPQAGIEKRRQRGRDLFEAYMDLMIEAAVHARKLKP